VNSKGLAGLVPHFWGSCDSGGGTFIWGGFNFLTLFGILVLLRDALTYLDWSDDVHKRFGPQRVGLAIHVLSASIALPVAPIQFSSRLRKR
jgi:hypothetical protein